MSVSNIDTRRAIALRQQLYGCAPVPRDATTITGEVADAARVLAISTGAWSAHAPTPAAVESARTTVAGLSRLLTELAAAQKGEPQ